MQQHLGEVPVPMFDWTQKCSACAWIQKINTYLSLNPMNKEEAIKFASLQLEEVAYEWLYHGIVTQGHNLITTFEEFS